MRTLRLTLSVTAILLALCCEAGCSGGGGAEAGLDLALRLPTGMMHAADADWQVSWTGGTGPYTVEWDFGGGAVPNTVVIGNAVSPTTTTVEMRNTSLTDPASYTVTVTVSDAQGHSDHTVTAYSVAVVSPALAMTDPIHTEIIAGYAADWSVSWTGGQAPYAVTFNFGGGGDPDNMVVANAVSPCAVSIGAIEPGPADPLTWTYTVTVTDSSGLTATATGLYTIGLPANQAPVVDNTLFSLDDYSLSVHVSDPDDGETLTVHATASEGLVLDAAEKVAARSGPLTAVFQLSPVDLLAGATGDVTVTVTDGKTTSAPLTPAVSIPPLAQRASPDTLNAVPLQSECQVGDEVTVAVISGVPAHPFQNMISVGVTVKQGAVLLGPSYDFGAPDDNSDPATPVDGIWAAMSPSGGFADLIVIPEWYWADEIGSGLWAYTFPSIVPVGGSDLTTERGILFNFRLRFDEPGEYVLGFYQPEDHDATYYTGADSVSQYWGDITNDHVWLPNTIIVTE